MTKTTGNKKNSASKKKTSKKKTMSVKKVTTKDKRDTGNRIPIQLLVDYKCDGHYLFDFCRDLGTGGVFIETPEPQPQGSTLDLTFTIPDSKETLDVKGTVMWVQAPLEERDDLTPGMGVQFEKFSHDQRTMLENFVNRYHGSSHPTKESA